MFLLEQQVQALHCQLFRLVLLTLLWLVFKIQNKEEILKKVKRIRLLGKMDGQNKMSKEGKVMVWRLQLLIKLIYHYEGDQSQLEIETEI